MSSIYIHASAFISLMKEEKNTYPQKKRGWGDERKKERGRGGEEEKKEYLI